MHISIDYIMRDKQYKLKLAYLDVSNTNFDMPTNETVSCRFRFAFFIRLHYEILTFPEKKQYKVKHVYLMFFQT